MEAKSFIFSERSCTVMRNYCLKPVYSVGHQLIVVAYAHTNYAELFAVVEISETQCDIKKINLCSSFKDQFLASALSLRSSIFARQNIWRILLGFKPHHAIDLQEKTCIKTQIFVDGLNQCYKIPFVGINLRVFLLGISFYGSSKESVFKYILEGVLTGQALTNKHHLNEGSEIKIEGRHVVFNLSVTKWKSGSKENISDQDLKELFKDNSLFLKPPFRTSWFVDVTCFAGLSIQSLAFTPQRFRKGNWFEICVVPASKWQNSYSHQVSSTPSSPISIWEDSALQLLVLNSQSTKNLELSLQIETQVSRHLLFCATVFL